MLLQTFVDEETKETTLSPYSIFNKVPVFSTSCLSCVLVSSRLERSPRGFSTRRLCTRKRTSNCPRSDRGLGAGRKRSFGTSRTARRTRRQCGRFWHFDAVVEQSQSRTMMKRFDDDANNDRHFRTPPLDGRRRCASTKPL